MNKLFSIMLLFFVTLTITSCSTDSDVNQESFTAKEALQLQLDKSDRFEEVFNAGAKIDGNYYLFNNETMTLNLSTFDKVSKTKIDASTIVQKGLCEEQHGNCFVELVDGNNGFFQAQVTGANGLTYVVEDSISIWGFAAWCLWVNDPLEIVHWAGC